MKTRIKIVIILVPSVILISIFVLFIIFPGLIFVVLGIDNMPRQLLDLQMEVTGVKPVYDVGESITFSVHVKSLGEFVPWPDFRIYKDEYVDNSSQPVYSRMYMTPIKPGDYKLESQIKWRERTWNFPLDDDTGNPMVDGDDDDRIIRFFEEGTYVLRVNAWAKQESLTEFQIVNSSRQD